MKKRIGTLLLAVLMLASVSVTVFAADAETVTGFYNIAEKANVEITPYTSKTAVAASNVDLNGDSNPEELFKDSNRLEVSYTAAQEDGYYGVVLVEGTGLPTKDNTICYINQETATSDTISFNVYPTLPEETTDLTLYITSNVEGFTLIPVSLGYYTGTLTEEDTTVHVTGVSLNKTSTALTVGEEETLTATVQPDNATNKGVSWSSSDTTVATVEGGVVKAVAAGTATITVTTADGGKTATCVVTVTETGTGTGTEILYGDVNSDGEVDEFDLLRLGKYFADWEVEINEAASDVNADGEVDEFDLLRLGKYFADWEVELGK